MNIAIIGAGFTGLSAAYELVGHNHRVDIYEYENKPGGLACGFVNPSWEWSLERHYHHVFASDKHIINLAQSINTPFTFTTPNSSSWIGDETHRLDSPLSVMMFEKLPIFDRIRMGMVIAYLKYLVSSGVQLEGLRASEWLPRAMGNQAYAVIWEPLLKGKFGAYVNNLSLAWFWARIKARTSALGYPEGGFQILADTLATAVTHKGGQLLYGKAVTHISQKEKKLHVHTSGHIDTQSYDQVLITLPNHHIRRLGAAMFPPIYANKLEQCNHLGAITVILTLREEMLPQSIYWLNICDTRYPFLAVVEHTHFVNKKYYNNDHIVYIGKYLAPNHPYMHMDNDTLLKEYIPYLAKIKPNISSIIRNVYVFKAPFAQPIMPPHYSHDMLPLATPIRGLYIANMQHIYPWDRGTNFAVELGQRVAKEMRAV